MDERAPRVFARSLDSEDTNGVAEEWTDLAAEAVEDIHAGSLLVPHSPAPEEAFMNLSYVDGGIAKDDVSSSEDKSSLPVGSLPPDVMFPGDQEDDMVSDANSDSKLFTIDDDETEQMRPNRSDDSSDKEDVEATVTSIREDYILPSITVQDTLSSAIDVHRDPSDDGDDVVSLIDMLRSDPPEEFSRPKSSSTSTCSDQCICESFRSREYLVFLVLVVLYLLEGWIFGSLSSHTSGELPKMVGSTPTLESTTVPRDSDAAFFQAFSREVAGCEEMCCFTLFILTGDSSAHADIVRAAMRRTKRWQYKQPVDCWTANEILGWTEGQLEAQSPVVLVEDADSLETHDVQRIIRFGRRRCRDPSKFQEGRPASRVVVLSTSFGSDKLNDPDEVLSDRFVEDFKRRDWLAVPEIVLNRHGIVHGIRGKRPQRVFEDFLNAHKGQAAMNNHKERRGWFGSFLSKWFGRKTCSAGPLVEGYNPVQQLDAWLETKRAMFAWTESARRVLADKVRVQSMSHIPLWLENQFSTWTKNGSCDSVLFRSSPTDVKAFNVACKSTANSR